MALTPSQVNRAGRVLRKWMLDPGRPFFGDVERQAIEVLWAFRAAHSAPLIKANNGLRSMVRSEGCAVQVSQRLKRANTMLDKLTRHPTMALASMQDVGGCRAILANLDELRRVEKRLVRRRRPVRVDDYVLNPRDSGYRAVHVIVQYDGRCIEIQLRTRLMHEWAVAVERLGGQTSVDLKSGEGPPEVLAWLEAVGDALAIEDSGVPVDQQVVTRIDELRTKALPFIARGHQ